MKPPNPAAQEWLEQATGFYIAARYPIATHYTLADARRAVKAARKADLLVSKLFQ